MDNFIKYWSYLVENEDKEISFETFLEKKESILFEASMKWPDDYLKKAKDRILNSPLGKSSWYLENFIDTDLNNFKDEFDTLAHKGSFALGFFLSIIKWFIEYSGSDKQKYQEFIEGKLDKIIGILNYVVSQKDDEVSQFHEISKTEKDKDGNPTVYRFKKLKDMSWSDFEKEVFQKYSDQISKSVELKNDFSKESDYEAIPIYSYEELYKKFGGDKTGYDGQSEWCHTNGRSTYNSWTDDGKYMFIVFAKKNWESIFPPDPNTANAYDDYGTSLIACLFETSFKTLLNSTLRWNHVIDPAKTKIGASVDNAFLNNNDLMNTVGIDLTKDLDEYFTKFRGINKITNFKAENGNVNCSDNKLISLKGAPQIVDGWFDCSRNLLTSLEDAPEYVGDDFDCSCNQLTSLVGAPTTSFEDAPVDFYGSFYCGDNKLTSLEGAPPFVHGHFNCSENKLTSLEGAPERVGGDFNCMYNKLTSLEGGPEKVGKTFSCTDNQLTSLKGCPKEIGRNFYCYQNRLTSLEGAPLEVDGNFNCSYNKLTSLKGGPQKVSWSFDCSRNQLTSLMGAPRKVGWYFECNDNKLTSLEGAPQEVGKYFECKNNQLTSLIGAPWKVGIDIACSGNDNLPEYKIKAYKAYLKLSDSEKAPLTKDNHYYPTEEWENKFK